MTRKITMMVLALFALIITATNSNAQQILSHSNNNYCDSLGGTVTTNATGGNYSLITYFGDGNTSTSQQGPTFWYYHQYTNLGTYTVKHVLVDNSTNTRLDSVQYTVNVDCAVIWGYAYKDDNSNCSFDANESTISAPISIQIDSNGVTIDTVTSYGGYSYMGHAGVNYTLTVINVPPTFNVTCPTGGSQSVTPTFATGTQVNFGFECGTASGFDLSGTFYWLRFRPVNNSYIYFRVDNSACQAQNAVATLTISPKYQFASANITPASVNGNMVTWNLANVSATNPEFILVTVTPNGTVNLGDTVCNSLAVTPTTGDINVANNNASSCDSVVASFDPNDKQTSPEGFVHAGTKLTYTINFENLGNDTAFNIHILDTLSNYLDASSFELLQSSHPVQVFNVDAGAKKIMKFDFANIYLPDASSPNYNKGYVMFSINTKSNLADGIVVDNRAGIYFDINPVVLTNTARNIIGDPLSVATLTNSNTIVTYPNPVADELTIKGFTKEYTRLQVVNNLGQVVAQQNISGSEAHVSMKQLSAGVYTLLLSGDSVPAHAQKIVKE